MSYGLVFLGLPPDHEQLKDADPGHPLGGAQVAEHALLAQVLTHARADPVVVVPDPLLSRADARSLLAGYEAGARAVLAFPEELPDLDAARVAILQPTTRIAEGASFRSRWGRPGWPVVGVAHALNGPDALQAAMVVQLRPELFGDRDTLICTSRAATEAWAQLQDAVAPPDGGSGVRLATATIPLGVDPSELHLVDRAAARNQLGLDLADDVFLCFGRLSPRSKMDPIAVLAGFLGAFRRDPSKVLVMAGDSTDGLVGELVEAVDALGLTQQVVIVENPSRAEKGACYGAADVFVQLGDNAQESFGLGLLEAMATGLPVIASDWSGYRDIVVDQVTGHLIPTTWRSEDYLGQVAGFTTAWDLGTRLVGEVSVDPERLIWAMRHLASDVAARATMGAAGRRRIDERFTWPAIVAAYDGLLDGLARIDSGPRTGPARPWPPVAGEVFARYATRRSMLTGPLQGVDDPDLLGAARILVPGLVEALEVAPGSVVDADALVEALMGRGHRRSSARNVVLRGIKLGLLRQPPIEAS